MYAIIESGGKQYRVEEGSRLRVEGLAVEEGSQITLDRVLLLGGESLRIGAPYVDGARVTAEVLEHGRGEKIRVFKKWRRNDARKLQGHRQPYTALRVTSILDSR
ncbi:MAG: 50S ribosomal protein L21 [Desulfovibrio sp.]|jgi:large subunit ribosomal protein L21|nr:50S ribosomal protein L21 [Desulfovibrio sp.]